MTNRYQCKECEVDIPEATVRTCWTDKYTQDHFGLCCDCFDVSLGMTPPVKLGVKQVARLPEDEDDKIK